MTGYRRAPGRGRGGACPQKLDATTRSQPGHASRGSRDPPYPRLHRNSAGSSTLLRATSTWADRMTFVPTPLLRTRALGGRARAHCLVLFSFFQIRNHGGQETTGFGARDAAVIEAQGE